MAYLTGRGVIIGADQELLPHAATDTGLFALYADCVKHPQVDICDTSLEVLAPGMFDFVVVGRRLDAAVDKAAAIREAASKLKVGGHLVVFCPAATADIPKLVSTAGGWNEKASYLRDDWTLQIYKRRSGRGITPQPPHPAKRACIARYGAMGDMIMVTPLIRRLAEDGYHVTVNCTRYSSPILAYNPYVHNIILQERDAIPNPDLGEYWREWEPEYDRYINLSESIEGRLLKVEGRRDFFTHQSWRHAECNRNYYDFTLGLGGYPTAAGLRGELYFNSEEERTARRFRDKFRDKFFVLWALNGSSHHKIYGLLAPVLADWLDAHPDAIAVTVGDKAAKAGEFEHPQVVRKAGEWPIRQSLAMTKYADVVVGPESVMTNAAGCFNTPKITLLSHSSHENLCKYWLNDFCLEPDPALAPCYPCHQLHYSKESCPLANIIDTETGEKLAEGPRCAMGAITGERMLARLNEVYSFVKANQPAVVV